MVQKIQIMNEITQNNIEIAKFMGWEYHKGFLLNPNNASQTFSAESFSYDTSWDSLMPVIRKINSLNKATQFAIFKTYVSCTVESGGKFYKHFSFSHAEYITQEQSDIQAAWKLVAKFVIWYQENMLTSVS
jgi:hypothetical protein